MFGIPVEIVAAIIAGIFAIIGWLGNKWFTDRNERRQLRKKLSKRRTMLCMGFTDREVEEDISLIPETFDRMNRKDLEVRRAYNRYIRVLNNRESGNLQNLVLTLLEKMGDATGEKLEYEEDSRFSQHTANAIIAQGIMARKIIEDQEVEDNTKRRNRQEEEYRQRMISGMKFALQDPEVIAYQKDNMSNAINEWLKDPAFKEKFLKGLEGLE
jgi:hypothetical protein